MLAILKDRAIRKTISDKNFQKTASLKSLSFGARPIPAPNIFLASGKFFCRISKWAK